MADQRTAARTNIVLVLADNLGWGELGCYGGGALRGAPTPRSDRLAAEGLRLTNFNVESDCVPTRSALMTGRHPIRTGALNSVPAGLTHGLTAWERLLPEMLSEAGYATACFGKWHLGDTQERLPNRRGFDEWFGLPRTMNESEFTSSLGYDRSVVPVPMIMEGSAGSDSVDVEELNVTSRRMIDAEIVRRSIEFMRTKSAEDQPFFLYAPLTQMHFPNLAHPDFDGITGYGDMADSLVELDHRVGQLVDAVDELGLAENTLFIFASDNGPEFRDPWRGTAGFWRGTYHTAMEGSLRVPCIVRWPGRVAPGQVSNEIVHILDLFATFARIGGVTELPTDRPIDSIDQSEFLLGLSEHSAREGFTFYLKTELRAVKWRDWKMHLYWEPEVNEGRGKLEDPYLFNLIRDPKEMTNVLVGNTWVGTPIRRMIFEFTESLKAFPPIPPGTPDPFDPATLGG